MGAGASKGLEQINQGIITSGLQQDERKFADEKLKQQMAHAESLQKISEAGATKRAEAGIASHEKIGAASIVSAEKIASANVLSQKEIHAATNEANKEIHRLTNLETRFATETAALNAKQASLSKVIDSVRDENRDYATTLLKLASDPNSTEYINAAKQLARNKVYLEVYQTRLGELTGATLPTQKERPALVLPGRSAAPGATPSTDALDQSSSAAPTNPNPFAGVSTAVPDQAGLAERAAGAFVPGMSILKGILKK
jgi:hypothetical protein